MNIKVVIYDDGKYLIKRHETALYSKMLFEEIFG
ncbi:unknown [Odoribacter laneus CAG:561]|mgnify:CR=1 FL=1|nr:unknown [Odoribacter laneus CAG:561]